MIHHAKDARKQSEIAAKGILEQELTRIGAAIERAMKEGKTSVELIRISKGAEDILKDKEYIVESKVRGTREDCEFLTKVSW